MTNVPMFARAVGAAIGQRKLCAEGQAEYRKFAIAPPYAVSQDAHAAKEHLDTWLKTITKEQREMPAPETVGPSTQGGNIIEVGSETIGDRWFPGNGLVELHKHSTAERDSYRRGSAEGAAWWFAVRALEWLAEEADG